MHLPALKPEFTKQFKPRFSDIFFSTSTFTRRKSHKTLTLKTKGRGTVLYYDFNQIRGYNAWLTPTLIKFEQLRDALLHNNLQYDSKSIVESQDVRVKDSRQLA